MQKSTFDPELYNFCIDIYLSDSEYKFWNTNQETYKYSEIGFYQLRYSCKDDWWTLWEIMLINGDENEFRIYDGRIPDNEWGFQLLKNMELELPVIQREIKIDLLNSYFNI